VALVSICLGGMGRKERDRRGKGEKNSHNFPLSLTRRQKRHKHPNQNILRAGGDVGGRARGGRLSEVEGAGGC
jgi:hypothetical protein